MALDVYDLCPCGSGKKLKFCCHAIAGEMERIAKLQENGQHRMADQALEALQKSHPGNPWVLTTRAAILLDQGQSQLAKEVTSSLYEAHPEHKFGLVLHALASFSGDGYEASKPIIQRALEQSSQDHPDLVSALAIGIAGAMYSMGSYMGARQHLALAMQVAPAQDQQNIFLRLLEFDSNGNIPYPLRSVHELLDTSFEQPEIEKDFRKAMKLADIGCWCEAAKIFTRLAEQQSDNAVLWHNTGLGRAWDADDLGAAEALHEAAQLHSNFEDAVECETVAQLLDLKVTEERAKAAAIRFEVPSVSKLLTVLNAHERMGRSPVPNDNEEDRNAPAPVAIYCILDRPVPNEQDVKTLTLDSLSNVLAQVSIFDADPQHNEPAQAILVGYEGDQTQAALELFQEVAGEDAQLSPNDEEAGKLDQSIPKEELVFEWDWYFSPQTPQVWIQKFEKERWLQTLTEVWPNTPLAALDGKTPAEAAQNPEQKLQRTAALYVLDAQCDARDYSLDFELLQDRLQVDPPKPVEVTPETQFNSFSVMKLHRLPLEKLTDAQISYTLNRALLIHHNTFLYRVLKEVLSRPGCVEQLDLERVYMTLADLCRQRFDRDEALSWIARGYEHAQTQDKPFQRSVLWDLRALTICVQDPEDPKLKPLIDRIWNQYCPKLPQLRTNVMMLLQANGIDVPADAPQEPSGEAGATSEGGIWTPGPAGEQGEGGEKKLWLPGQ